MISMCSLPVKNSNYGKIISNESLITVVRDTNANGAKRKSDSGDPISTQSIVASKNELFFIFVASKNELFLFSFQSTDHV